MASNWENYFSRKAEDSHLLMVVCGVFIFPAFGILDYLLVPNWVEFVAVRILGSSLLVVGITIYRKHRHGSLFLAHFSTQVVFTCLMWMISQQTTPLLFFLYAINSCTAFIASALFLLWDYKHSLILATVSLITYLLFQFLYSPLTHVYILSSGSFLLFTIIIMSQLYVNYRYRSVRKDFQMQEYLNILNQELTAKNTHIAVQNKEIKKQKEHLQQLNHTKDKLLMIVSHDFRSPLHSLNGAVQLLNKPDRLTREEISHLVQGLRTQLNHTEVFVENLLRWVKDQINGSTINLVPLPIKELVREVVDLLEPVGWAKQLTLRNETSELHTGLADPDIFRLIMRNLLNNAIKFSFPGGEVIIRSALQGGEVILSIQDFGTGISKEDQELLLATGPAFTRIGTSQEKGTGFGLQLCKEFISKNGGRFWIDTLEGKGSTFYFSLRSAESAFESQPLLEATSAK